ncbi:4-hydroxy-tetrahydrodipicolinate synthase [Telmatospirillum sp.]|uniref:4-hydroxy-tetrahydrodipicolinate synthase n=1 Tax=Telmatospirillum sp. TaxID=2079197 RepID=UPI0028479D6A|nr:4-hydroxy-tetrahydrodipicolinate synthase [Telmatospirillum sp.]MDR3437847.1 4-hydroxy-tetrahydrodipicolinate synthase [Telmatospirillum sp.]
MFDKTKYGRILVPMLTPFAADQSVDLAKCKSLATYLVEKNMADTLILSGTTGEFHTQTFAERVSVFEAVKQAVGGKIPLIAGVGCPSTMETIALAKKAQALGFETVMIVAPYYTKPAQQELYAHYAEIAEAVPTLNLILYNIPIFTGVNLEPCTVGKLARKYANIVAIKEEAELNPKQMTAFLNATPENFIVYNGDDTMILEAYTQGGDARIGGVISGASHVVGLQVRKMIETFLAGNVAEAAMMQRKLFPLLRIMGQNGRTNPAPLWKDAMKLWGVDAGLPRRPLTPGTPEEVANVRKAMVEYGLL